MPLQLEPNVDLTPLNTLGITATADWLVRINAQEQLAEVAAAAQDKKLPLFVLGGGSNIVLGQERLHALVIKIEIGGREILKQTDESTTVAVAAGENWDGFVAWSVGQGLRGIESLSLIPGTVGAAPVQNVGAYGQEVSQTIAEVVTFNLETGRQHIFSNAGCRFAYRDSMFKHEGRGRFIITGVTFRLVPQTQAAPPTYASLQAELDRRNIANPTVSQIREAVIAIRTAKLPDPAVTPTAGSFFHNVIVAPAELERLQHAHPDIPHWPAADGKIKISASWLVDQCGFKGKIQDGVGMYDKQAIALVNPGHRPAADVLAFRDHIIATVHQRFGVTLAMEPELVSF